MTSEERTLILVTARLLRAAARITWLAIGLTILAGAAIVIGRGGRTAAIAALILGIIAIFFGVRVAFDASLFEDLANEQFTTTDLDTALGTIAKADQSGRSWPDRCRGARRLVMKCALATATQAMAVAFIGWSMR